MRDGQAATFGGGSNVLAVFKDRPNAKTIILTANPDVIYGLAFVDLKDGPVFSRPRRRCRGCSMTFGNARSPMSVWPGRTRARAASICCSLGDYWASVFSALASVGHRDHLTKRNF
jgi:hypothetical protein